METDERRLVDKLELSAQQLRGKQSVRATFRLSDQMIDLLKVAANHLEVKQKSLLDELVQDRETLALVASESKGDRLLLKGRRQKTLVLSRNSLSLLDDISNRYDLSRDQLIELCIGRLIPFVDAEQEKHAQRRLLIKDVDDFLDQGKKLLDKANRTLGAEDRFRVELENIVHTAERNLSELKKFVKDKQTLHY